METKEQLKEKISSFSELEYGWDSYNAEKITKKSIFTAIKLIETLFSDAGQETIISVFPMRNGGIQFEIGEYREIEILEHDIDEIEYDSEYNVIRKESKKYKPTCHWIDGCKALMIAGFECVDCKSYY